MNQKDSTMESDLSAITSLSVIKLIEKAKNCPSQSSVQLNETLQNAGLIDCTEGETRTIF